VSRGKVAARRRSFRFRAPAAAVTLGTLLLAATLAAGRGPAAKTGGFSVALTGDTILTRPLRAESGAGFVGLLELLRGADAALTNLETLFHDYEAPAVPPGMPSMRSDPALAKDLAWAGFDLVSRANNHAGDYGPEGMARTSRALAAAGILSAGVGDELGQARAAALYRGANASVALISAASYFPEHARASERRGAIPARPGISPLRHLTTYVLTAARMRELKSAVAELGIPVGNDANRLSAFERTFVVGDRPGVRTEPNPADLEAVAASIRAARPKADCVIVSLHAHEGLEGDRFAPAEFVAAAAHAAIDAGADAVFGHGPHVLRGIEVYRGRPILYSLGNFVFEYETIRELPSDEYERLGLPATAGVADFYDKQENFGRFSYPAERESWESVVAILHGRGRLLSSVELRPISLGFGQPRGTRGVPRLAPPDLAKKILADLARLSKPFKTSIAVRGDAGWIELTGGR
jgi:poly-gamma-glutamate capsule biosynthesis protein CapA/YwtB (metallophosphatase superfamily)